MSIQLVQDMSADFQNPFTSGLSSKFAMKWSWYNKQAVGVATQYAPAPLIPWAPKRLARRRADAT